MNTTRIVKGWRVGFVVGSGMIRLWLFRWIVTLYDTVGSSKAN